MQKLSTLAGIIAISFSLAACNDKSNEPLALQTVNDKASYSFGIDIAERLKEQGIVLNVNSLNRGISDGFAGATYALNDEERIQAKTDFQEELRNAIIQKQSADGELSMAAGKAFLTENASKPGVVTTDSGLQYKIITSGDGEQPKASDTVTTHYKGTLIDGREFDSSYKRNQPASFPVKGVIKGWTEALQLMHVGDKWQLFIPSELAYGASKRSELIQPNSTLVFEIELLGIKE